MGSNLILNMVSNISSLGLTVFLSIWMTPYIINALGEEAFGFIPLTQNLISLLSVITIAVSSMLGRYVTVAFQQEKQEHVQKYVSTYFVSSTVLSGLLSIPLIIVSIFIDKVINVPENLLFDVRVSFIMNSILFFITFIGSTFAVASFCLNKLYIENGIQVTGVIIRTLLTTVLLTIFVPQIWYVNLSYLITGVITVSLSLYYFKKLLPDIKIRIKDFQTTKLKDLIGSGVWNSVNQIGVILFLQIDLLVINLTIGASEAGQYAAILQFPMVLRTISGTVATVFAPMIIYYYSKNNMNGLIDYSNYAVKLNGLIIALPAALLSGMPDALLRVWLGANFEHLKFILIINSSYLVLVLGAMPLFHIATAVNKLKIPAIITIILGCLNLLLAILLSGPLKLGLYGIAIAGGISLIIKNIIFTPIYSAKITRQPIFTYYKGILRPLVGAGFAILVCQVLQFFYYIHGWISLIITSLIVTVSYVIFVFVFLLTGKEREQLVQVIKRPITKQKNRSQNDIGKII